MSVEATIWAWSLTKQQVSSLEKLVLLSMADRADENHECWPSKERLALDTCGDRKSMFIIIKSLIKKALIKATGEKKGIRKNVDVYQLIGVGKREKSNSTENGTVKDFNSTENGTGKSFISTENGTMNRTENGIQNLSVEPNNKNINIYTQKISFQDYKDSENIVIDDTEKLKSNYKNYATKHKRCIEAFDSLWKESGVNIEEAYDTCQLYWETQNKVANWANFKTWLIHPKSLEPFKPFLNNQDISKNVDIKTETAAEKAKRYAEERKRNLDKLKT